MNKKNTSDKDSMLVPKSKGYSKMLQTLCYPLLLLIVMMGGCKKDNFNGEVVGVCSIVASTDPMDKAVDVVLDKVISVTFNTAMKPSTVNKLTFIIMQGSTAISGTVSPTANAAVFTFKPDVALLPFTVYTGTITTGATDTLRTALVSNYVWSFTTIPQVTLASNPAAGGTSTGSGTFAQGSSATVTATPAAGYTFTNWTDNGTVVSTSSSYQFTIAGNRNLVANFALVIPGKFAVNLSSSPVAGGTTTGSGSFNGGSSVTVAATPGAGYTFVNWTEGATIVSTSTSYTFILTANRTLVANFAVIPAGKFALNLSANPAAGGSTNGSGLYTSGTSVTAAATQNTGFVFVNWTEGGVIVSTSASYIFALNANRTLVANFSPGLAVGPGQINLGAAGSFTILTKSGISTTGITSVGGDIGVSPAAATAITGFGLILNSNGQSSHTPIVTGLVYAADYASPTPTNMTTAVADMQTAYTTANGLTVPAPIVDIYAGSLGGKILTAGLYKWSTGVLISSAGLTLTGGPNDTWVFQISQDLTVNNTAAITLLGGAQAKNIFWVVAGQATLGTNVNFNGNILSKTLISLNTGTVVNGRLLAQTAVTLNASTVNLP